MGDGTGIRWARARNVVLWVTSMAVGLGLMASGVARLRLTPAVVAQFEAFGYTSEFARSVGIFEVLGGLALLVPRFAVWSATGLSLLMLGAIWSHVASGYGSPFHAARTLIFLVLIVALRVQERGWKSFTLGSADPPTRPS